MSLSGCSLSSLKVCVDWRRSQITGERLVNVVPIFKKDKKGRVGYCRFVNHHPWENDGASLLGSNSCTCEESVCWF